MTWSELAALAAAAVIVGAPYVWTMAEGVVASLFSDDHDHAPAPLVGPSYKEAISALANVRLRLRSTDCLDEDRKKAIDVLTLGLVDGSDK